MSLPVRFQTAPGGAAVVSVDGVFGAPGLHLSHWPGNETPPGLKRDLSTGIALEFARLPERERARLTAGCEAIAINHYDTDGLCALFAVVEPEAALEHADLLLAAAEAGDRFRVPSVEGFRIDAALTNLARPERSPLPRDLFALPARTRHARLVDSGLELLKRMLVEGSGAFEALFAPEERALESDLRDLAAAAMDDLVHLDLAVWTAAPGRLSTREGSPPAFDPGRHAMFGSTRADRVLALGPAPEGTTARFVIGSGSFFDLTSEPSSARPDLAALAARLNELEGGRRAAAPLCWRHQDGDGASPELWFGAPDLSLYVEHAAAHLGRSRLAAGAIKSAVLDAVRAAFRLPDDDDVAAPGEDVFAV